MLINRNRWGFLGLLPTVDPDPAGAGEGGGGTGAAGAAGGTGEEDLGDKGRRALEAERQQVAQLRAQLSALKGAVDPKVYADAVAKAEAAEQALKDKEAAAKLAAKELEEKYAGQLKDASTEATTAKQQLAELKDRVEVQGLFAKGDGLSVANDAGESAFDVFWRMRRDSFKRDDKKKLYIVDGQGDPLLDKEGKRVDPAAWVKSHSEDPIYAFLFKSAYGAGGDGRSSRQVPGRKEDIQSLSKKELFSAWNED